MAIEAPLNDFRLMRQLLEYTNAAVSTVTSKKLSLHLWYLSEELVPLALFDSRVSTEVKKLMVAAMQREAPSSAPKHPIVKSAAFLGDTGLEQFCTVNSKKMFTLLGIPEAFLTKEPYEWEDDETFQEAKHKIKNLADVNDRAERGVALI
jgi:hypothetical protein